MPPRLLFPSASEHPSEHSVPEVPIKHKSYSDMSVVQQPATLLSDFNPGLYMSRASPLSHSPAGQQGPSVHTPARVTSMASPEQQLMVSRSLVAMGSRLVLHPLITSPVRVSPIQTQGLASGKAAAKLFTTQPRSFVAPAHGSSSLDLGDDGCPAWGAEFCLRSARGTAVYLEQVATVREVEVLSTELLDHDPYIASQWHKHWSHSGLRDESQLRLIHKQGMLSLNAEYIAWAHCATTRLHTWGEACKHEPAEG